MEDQDLIEDLEDLTILIEEETFKEELFMSEDYLEELQIEDYCNFLDLKAEL